MRKFPRHLLPLFPVLLLATSLCGCVIGPDFQKPTPQVPADWSAWHGGEEAVHQDGGKGPLASEWWLAYQDPVLDDLQKRALKASPDLQTAALHFAQARAMRQTVAAQRGVEMGLGASASRQRQSEYGQGTRLIDAISPDRDAIVSILSEPFTAYQMGFDASWEPDLWGRIRRSIEAADSDVAQQAALLDLARLSLASEVARSYFQLRTAQRQVQLAREDIQALDERTSLLQVRVDQGVDNHLDLDRQQADLMGVRARLPGALAEEVAAANQLALLLGEHPGALQEQLRPLPEDKQIELPDLALGVPSEIAQRRPDILAAEARLHRATANVGVAQANLYPSIRLGAHFGYESYLSDKVLDWASRTYSGTASVNLPIFDGGRRRSTVALRKLELQEAAVGYQKTLLQAWQEIDNALSAYSSARAQQLELEARQMATADAYGIAQARYDAGLSDFLVVLDSRRNYLQSRRDLADSEGAVRRQYAAVNKAVGNITQVPTPPLN